MLHKLVEIKKFLLCVIWYRTHKQSSALSSIDEKDRFGGQIIWDRSFMYYVWFIYVCIHSQTFIEHLLGLRHCVTYSKKSSLSRKNSQLEMWTHSMRGFERYTHNSLGTLRVWLLTTCAEGKAMGRKWHLS